MTKLIIVEIVKENKQIGDIEMKQNSLNIRGLSAFTYEELDRIAVMLTRYVKDKPTTEPSPPSPRLPHDV